jgi:myo-inositol 2-dehydrogenase/D-chiro-inositol 1-dehydrogenase
MTAMAQPLVRAGFIGCGNHSSRNLYPSLRYAPIDLIAVCDLVAEKAERNARLFGVRHAYTDYRRMLDEQELDAVFIVGGPVVHYELGLEVLGRGYHVFIEKPPCHTLAEADRLLVASRAANRNLMVGFMKRFAPAYLKAREITRSPEFGGIAQLHIRFGHWAVTDYHHMLTNMHSHMLDLGRYFAGEIARLHVEKYLDDMGAAAAITARYQSGAVGTFIFDAHQPRIQERMEVSGGGNLVIVDDVVRLEHRKGERPADPDYPTFVMTDRQSWQPEFAVPNLQQTSVFLQGYVGEIREFAQAILEGRPTSVTARDAVEVMRLIEAIERVDEGTIEIASVTSSGLRGA